MSGPAKANDLLGQIPTAERGLPPVHLWNPDFCGQIDMRIARDGTWYYLGSPIGRKAMVRLFSTILKREGEQWYLVTPVEKVGIQVEDAPFVAIGVEVMGQGEAQTLRFTDNCDNVFEAGPEHPVRVETDPLTGEPSPYVRVRGEFDALIHRNVFYELVELAVPGRSNGLDCLGVWSGGCFFALGPAS
ncbi:MULTISPECIES: DUF1285 domain-containing protein [unclassified Pseudomonas]|uniref:DUF1285 domain-containing protein n=1 Tax=unclassified Pseudomonas TaxID=196821 RepID=UPI000BDC38D9|nr:MULTISPECIES: DUF1285 domain-containing protein [unclassified Pseudomonas]PVZ16173.1 hypothetical protein F474_01678 [Pseudomonas sp. URIL14HWK12:I12]PVZ25971.1 hypothetical protein F470_01432 [Pseudomonas sp. URIL14HWK12:I10]PVZ36505.1 hypothetical protein F472_01678 [Pseudomonas sp. URIL14HWK12:I11]SNZ18567.1 hypothetical protein SAMN05660463_04142 [Pseudomonas sp. URIL14HWK12:I9]